MLNFDTKKCAIEGLKETADRYKAEGEVTTAAAVALHQLRRQGSADVVRAAENYISALVNAPREFKKSIGDLKIAVERFEGLVAATSRESVAATVQSGVMAGVAVGSGVAVMTAGPAAAMAIATTFGTASTGTAISALSGAAATNAALAWLGGGALAVGGGGMAVGTKVIAVLAGPVGWAVGGAALVGTAVWTHSRNGGIAEKAAAQALEIEGKIRTLAGARVEIEGLHGLTRQLAEGALAQLARLRAQCPSNFHNFSPPQKQEIQSLVNSINAFGELLNKQVS